MRGLHSASPLSRSVEGGVLSSQGLRIHGLLSQGGHIRTLLSQGLEYRLRGCRVQTHVTQPIAAGIVEKQPLFSGYPNGAGADLPRPFDMKQNRARTLSTVEYACLQRRLARFEHRLLAE